MEKRLQSLFDYQRFSGNARLASVIGEVEKRYGQQLSDDDLLMINAAGNIEGNAGSLKTLLFMHPDQLKGSGNIFSPQAGEES